MASEKREQDNPQNCINANLRKASRVITKLYVSSMAETGLQGTQFTLLSTISGHTECTITELAHYLIMDQTTVTRSIEKLRQQGYVEVKQGEDRRERILRLTEAGKQIIQASYPKWQAIQSDVWSRLGQEKSMQLLALINDVVEIAEEG